MAAQALEPAGARRLRNESFFSAPQLDRDPFGHLESLRMIVVLHVVAGAAVAHVASTRLRNQSDSRFRRPGLGLIAFACFAGLLSHGVLDGLKHGYPISAVPDIIGAAVLATAWCFAVYGPLRLLFAAVIAAALLPDVIDHGTAMLRWKVGWDVPVSRSHIFPWHWPEGSGSLQSGGSDPARSIEFGRNRQVSTVNQVIVLILATGCILTASRAFRFVPDPFDARAA